MFVVRFLTILASFTSFSIVAANDLALLNSNVEVRNAPGSSSAETIELIRRSLANVALRRATDTVYKDNVTLDTSWNDEFLFKMAVYVIILDCTFSILKQFLILCT